MGETGNFIPASHDFHVVNRLCGSLLKQPEKPQPVEVRVARTFEELQAAYRLVYQEYVLRGFCPADETGMHYTFYCFLPSSRTFILKSGGRVMGTLTLIMDSPCGLPLDAAFAAEVDSMRSPARALAEVSLLALNREFYQAQDRHLSNFRKLAATFFLFKTMLDYVRTTSLTDFVIAVHPRQEPLYQAFTFRTIGAVRPYRPACGHPAIAMHANIQQWYDVVPQEPSVQSYFLQEHSPDSLNGRFEWNAGSIRAMLMEKKIPSAAREHLQMHYPDLRFS